MFEVLLSKEEKVSSEDLGDYYRLPIDNRDLNYEKFFDHGRIDAREMLEFNSDNTEQLSLEGIVEVVKPVIQRGFHD